MSWKALQQPNWSTFSVGLALQGDPSVLRTTTMKCQVQFHESWWHFHYLPLPTVQTENATKSQLSEDTAESPTNIYELSWEEADGGIFLIREFHECGHNILATSLKRRTYVQGQIPPASSLITLREYRVVVIVFMVLVLPPQRINFAAILSGR